MSIHIPPHDWHWIDRAVLSGTESCAGDEHVIDVPLGRVVTTVTCKCGNRQLTATPDPDGGWDITEQEPETMVVANIETLRGRLVEVRPGELVYLGKHEELIRLD